PVPVYRIEQRYRTQVLTGQYILFIDLHRFVRFVAAADLTAVERVLDRLLGLVGEVCREFAGTNRFSVGDAHCLSFSEPDRAMAAAERLARQWSEFHRRERVDCSMTAALHKGTLNLFRSYLHSSDLNVIVEIADAIKNRSDADGAFFVTSTVARELAGTPWQGRLESIQIGPDSGIPAEIEVRRVASAAPGES